ncbi:MAG: fumarylacetoacetate hydrolase family protein, partial [Syntrophobacteraceae bacterium]|nr:fumarylacetoacetate hydrolase family protein [Syntrophobacteraceae bacterium]
MVTLPIANTDRFYTLNPTKIIALGLNYRDHIAESHSVNVRGFTDEIPPEPILFPKTPNVLIGPEEPIVIPAFLKEYGFEKIRTDYEAELAIIIGRRCKNIQPPDSWEV